METSTPTSGKTDSQPMDHHNQARTRSLLTRSAVLACGRSSVAVTSRVLILLNRWSGMLPPFLEIAVTPNVDLCTDYPSGKPSREGSRTWGDSVRDNVRAILPVMLLKSTGSESMDFAQAVLSASKFQPGSSIRGFPYRRSELAGEVFRDQARSYGRVVAPWVIRGQI